jgi:toxin ParE1/3/4
MRFRFSVQAEIDIEDIGDFIARDNPVRAVSFVQQLRGKCQELVAFPAVSPARPDYGEGVRLAVFGRYVILYVFHDDFLEIRRVLHGMRNLNDDDFVN